MMGWLKRLWDGFLLAYNRWLVRIPKGVITYSCVRDLLEGYAKIHNIYISDEYFATTDFKSLQRLVRLSPIRYRKYLLEDFDCDNFSLAFAGLCKYVVPNLAVGICWDKGHAFNFAIVCDENGGNPEVVFIEPQNNQVFKPAWSKGLKGKIKLMVI